MLQVGQVVAGRYRLDRHLGDGGSGAVWGATQLLTRESVALKFLRKPGEERSRRFLREGRIATTLRHPNIVAVRDLFEREDNELVMVMDLVNGDTLAARLRRGALSLGDATRVGIQIARALVAAHELGVVHRDLKPANVLLSTTHSSTTHSSTTHSSTTHSSDLHVQIVDFGIAKVMPVGHVLEDTTASTETGALLGTPHYMAPEQVFGERDVDASADVWSLGVVLYECLTGVKPFDGANYGQIFKSVTTCAPTPLASLRPDCPASLVALVDRMLDRDRRARPLSREIEEALVSNDSESADEAPAPAHEPETPLRESPAATTPPRAGGRSSLRRAVTAAAIVLFGAGVAGTALVRASRTMHTTPMSATPPLAAPLAAPLAVTGTATASSATTTSASTFTASSTSTFTAPSSSTAKPSSRTAATAASTKTSIHTSASTGGTSEAAGANAAKLPGGVHAGSPY